MPHPLPLIKKNATLKFLIFIAFQALTSSELPGGLINPPLAVPFPGRSRSTTSREGERIHSSHKFLGSTNCLYIIFRTRTCIWFYFNAVYVFHILYFFLAEESKWPQKSTFWTSSRNIVTAGKINTLWPNECNITWWKR